MAIKPEADDVKDVKDIKNIQTQEEDDKDGLAALDALDKEASEFNKVLYRNPEIFKTNFESDLLQDAEIDRILKAFKLDA